MPLQAKLPVVERPPSDVRAERAFGTVSRTRLAPPMSDAGRSVEQFRPRFASPWLLGSLAFCWAAALTVVFAVRVRHRLVQGNVQVVSFRHPSGALEHLAGLGDAQTFVAVARDPAIRHLAVWVGGPAGAALRFSRPLVGYLIWIASFGQPRWAPYAVAALSCASCAATIVLAARLLGGERPWLVLLLLVTPTYLATIDYMGADFVALASRWVVCLRGGQAAAGSLSHCSLSAASRTITTC